MVALDGLDLDVRDGELLALVGPSGSGKSTALRVAAGLERPDRGRVLLAGEDATAWAPKRRKVAMVFQDGALYPHLTVAQNLRFGLRHRGVDADEAERRVRSAVAQLRIEGLVDRYPDQLSGGEAQRVALGRALVREPVLFLLDEPLSSLDAPLRVSVRTEIVELQARLGVTTLFVTHDQAEAMTVGSRIAVLAAGRLHQVGTPQDVYDHPRDTFVAASLGSPPMNLVPGGGELGGRPGTTVGFRPEDLHVAAPAPDAPVRGTVVVVEPVGSETLLSVATSGGLRLWVRVGPRSGLRPGEAVALLPDEERRHTFDAAGRRVEVVAGDAGAAR